MRQAARAFSPSAAPRLFFANSKLGSMASAFPHASIALFHCCNRLYAAQMLL